MGSLAQSYFSQRIEECRASFDKGSFGFLRWFGLRLRPTYAGFDLINEPMKPHYEILTRKGQVVWGSVAQVNMGMFAPGPEDLPGVTIYSTDRYYDANPQDLCAIGRACFQFKGTEPVDVEFKPVAMRLTDEFDSTVRMQLPKRLTDNREVFLGATMFHRTRLPGGVLRGSLFPMVIAPEATEVNMVLQLPYWSKTLCDTWHTLQDTLEGIKITSTAQQVAEAAEKHPAPQRPADWDTTTTPVYVTPAMVEAYYSIIKQLKLDFQPYLVIGIRPDGTKYADFIPNFDRRLECTFKSSGISIVIRKDQRERLRGAIVDYKDTVFAKGLVIRLQGE